MIKIEFYENGFVVKGHSEYDQTGKDIICSAVSAIIMGSLNWFMDDDYISVRKGYTKLIIHPDNLPKEQLYLKLIKIQLLAMNHGPYKTYLEFHESHESLKLKGKTYGI